MPTLNVQTNVPVDGVVQSDILKDASKAIAKILGKPESYVLIILRPGTPMSFGGTEEPAAYAELVSIGGINPANNKKVSAAISEIFESKLSVPASRFYIKFYDVKVIFARYQDCPLHALVMYSSRKFVSPQVLVSKQTPSK